MEKYEVRKKNVSIVANDIKIGESVSFGNDVHIRAKGTFSMGNFSRLGNKVEIFGNNIIMGDHLFHSSGLKVGGGGRQNPNANLLIGNRCTIHNNFINVCEPVVIGDDVGLSPEVSILTHGYWLSVLGGYPASFEGVKIGNGVIIGYRSLILMGVDIIDNCVIGAQSVVTKKIDRVGVYAGSPAKFVKDIIPLTRIEKEKIVKEIIESYVPIAKYHGINSEVRMEFPKIYFKDLVIDVETFYYGGIEDADTDDLRDYLRKWGIRIYTDRPFMSKFSWE